RRATAAAHGLDHHPHHHLRPRRLARPRRPHRPGPAYRASAAPQRPRPTDPDLLPGRGADADRPWFPAGPARHARATVRRQPPRSRPRGGAPVFPWLLKKSAPGSAVDARTRPAETPNTREEPQSARETGRQHFVISGGHHSGNVAPTVGVAPQGASSGRRTAHRRHVTASTVGRTSPPTPCPTHPAWHAGTGSDSPAVHRTHATACTARPDPTRRRCPSNSLRCAAANAAGSRCSSTGTASVIPRSIPRERRGRDTSTPALTA